MLLFQNSRKKCVWCPPFRFFPLPREGDGNLRLCSGSFISAQPQHSLPTIKSGGGALGSAPLQTAQSELLEASPLGVAPRSTRIPSAPLSGTSHTFPNLFHFGCLPVLSVILCVPLVLRTVGVAKGLHVSFSCCMSVLVCVLSRHALLIGVFLFCT